VLPVARREARERALSLLYEAEAKGTSPGQVLDELPVPPDAFTVDLVKGVGANSAAIDELIQRHSIGWSLDRMPAIDRALLRMATFELMARSDVPTGVVLSEAVDLAGMYSTEESGRFVNGVLSSVAADVRPAAPPVG
jgi:transcription antitermination protein NusB